jgi:hypothetical protein
MQSAPRLSAIRRHWFFLPAIAVLAGAIVVTRTADWVAEASIIESALLFDLAVLLPALYYWCYRGSASSPALRALALCCAGIWVASHLVPEEHHDLPGFISWLRYAAIGLLLYGELRVVASVYWAVIGGHKSAESAAADLSATTGMPPRVAALLAKEAAFWRRVLARPLRVLRDMRRK